MYSTCLFCNQPLGRNEVVEHFPVGRRLAYDAAKGRLWVVCRRCERWNLTPLEERWEAIEECERLFRDTRLRVSTDNVGLARLREGLELVRIGEPLRPEFAAWRYGDQFGRRRRRQLGIAGASVAALGAIVVGGAVAGVGIGGFIWLIQSAAKAITHGSPSAQVATLVTPDGRRLEVQRGHLAETSIEPAVEGLVLHVRHRRGMEDFSGVAAQRAAAQLMPQVNRYGGKKADVAEAVREIEAQGSAAAFLDRIARVSRVTTRPARTRHRDWGWTSEIPRTGLFGLHGPQRLALEMALHEEQERRALEGELAELEQAWRQAEEIAGIADNLLLPPGVEDFVRQQRAKTDRPDG
ncbi:hypothetical protein J421_3108 [Gemmatirosa kalamazoonensis]|uniref:Uncharacterized protein n=1 Tax=Gemmatirosa kalamazoonensis TaxID=861299 RepID=W0RJX7_9BACT|nr:hypothetical protein [Gemmatirosa kalamazoonensis]AHG90645.1 hypothetical protein J421_3108 [Gemmatirosa kalamazoonensis]